MKNINIICGNIDDLDIIQPLWEKLNKIHEEKSPHFEERFKNMTWAKRKSNLIEHSGNICLHYAVENAANKVIGYSIAAIDKHDNKVGEIESIFVEQEYRKTGLGKELMNKAMDWLIKENTETQKLLVAAGNEDVFEFYKQFDFLPLFTVLQKRK